MADAKSVTNVKAVTDAKSSANLKPVEGKPATDAPSGPAYVVDPVKARDFFQRAAAGERTRNWDYVVTYYVMGLQYDSDNVEMCKKLMNAALNRKAAGGKPGGGIFGETYIVKGKGPHIAWLNALESVAKDPDNVGKWETVVKACSTLGNHKVAEWLGDQFLQHVRNDGNRSSKLKRLILLKNHYKAIEKYQKARLAAEEALPLDRENLELNTEIKNLAAMHTTQSGNYESATKDGASFIESVQNFGEQVKNIKKSLDVKSEEFLNEQIAEAKAKWEKEPKHTGLLRAYVAALLRKEVDETENEAARLLETAYEQTKEYQLHVQAQEVLFRQRRRKMRQLKEKIAATTTPEQQKAALAAKLDQMTQELLSDEIAAYRERIEKYPTDKELRYELGTRCLQAGLIDEAIDNLQIAEAVPKLRIKVLNELGQAFMKKGWYPEAVETYQKACKTYEIENDPTSKELHYNLAVAYEQVGQMEQAMNEFSQVARWQLTFRDVRDRLQRLRNMKKPGT